MNEPRDYTPRHPTVTALRYDGANNAAVALFVRPAQLVRMPGRVTALEGFSDGSSAWLNKDDWIVKSGETFSVMSAAEFKATYEAVE